VIIGGRSMIDLALEIDKAESYFLSYVVAAITGLT
jgi:hypothetical protein